MRHEKILHRNDGSVVRLVAIYCPNPIGVSSIDHFALVKAKGSDKEKLVIPHVSLDKSLGGLSVDEYIKHGRKGLMSVVRPHEIFKVDMELREKLSVGATCH